MKKLFFILALLIASPVYAQFVSRPNCDTDLTAANNETVCLQTTTVGGRTAGQVYVRRAGAWVDIDTSGSGAPTAATYITQTAHASLSAEQALGALATGILKSTTTTGVLSIAVVGTDYLSPSGSGAALTALNATQLTSGTVPTARLGSGTANTTTFLRGDNTWTTVTATCPTCVTSTAAMTASRLIIGAGSQGVAVLSSLGTSTQVLHGNASGAPTFSAVSLTADVSGTLPVASGGTNLTTAADDNVLLGNGTTWQSKALPNCPDASGQHLNYDTSSNSFVCGISGGGGGGGSSAFSAITSSTNITATMTVGTGASLVPSGEGIIQATSASTSFMAQTFEWSGTQDFTDAVIVGLVVNEADTIDTVFDRGKEIDGANSQANCFKIGNGTNYWCIYHDSVEGLVIEASPAANARTRIPTNQTWALYDVEGAAVIETVDPDAANTNAMWQYTTAAYRPKKSLTRHAQSLYGDGTQCPASASIVTINSGAPRHTFICADNDGSSIYGEFEMPDSWDGGTVTLMGRFVQTAADTANMNADVGMSCRGDNATINNTWGTEIAMDTAMTGTNATDTATTAAITPNGTCTGSDRLLQFRWQLDATGTTTAVATLHVLDFKLEYSNSSRSD